MKAAKLDRTSVGALASVLLVSGLMIPATSAEAQAGPRWAAGPVLGVSGATIREAETICAGADCTDGYVSSSAERRAPLFGAFLRYRVSPAFSVQAEAHVVRKGDRDMLDARERLDADYLELPVLARLQWERLSVLAGAYVSPRLRCDYAPLGTCAEAGQSSFQPPVLDRGYMVGAGLELARLGPGPVRVEARFTGTVGDVQNRVWQIALAWDAWSTGK